MHMRLVGLFSKISVCIFVTYTYMIHVYVRFACGFCIDSSMHELPIDWLLLFCTIAVRMCMYSKFSVQLFLILCMDDCPF